jgi:hypothetical protein
MSGMEQVLQVNVIAVTFVASFLIPLAVAALTKSGASSTVKAVLNLGLTVATGVCACVIQAKGSVTLGQITTAVMAAFTGSGLSYQHLWKPTGVAASVSNSTPDFGIGSPEPVTTVATPSWDATEAALQAAKEQPPADPPTGFETLASPVAPDPIQTQDGAPLTAHGAQVMADNSLLVADASFLAIITPVVTSEGE